MNSNDFMDSGSFLIGCNYWASHAGMMMWRDWDAGVVAEDIKQLAREGLQVLRVFPLWPDFQPLDQIYGCRGVKNDLCVEEKRIGEHPIGNSCLSENALEKFTFLADTAQKEGIQLIVGLVTGWMSGRLFVPKAFEGLNLLTDPLAMKWQSRFVRGFVKRFKDHQAISAWDLGNECNCLAPVDNSDQAWVWTELISGSIRQEDNTRQIISGMHSLKATGSGNWRISDQGELTDILTTHPYPLFTPHCDQDPLNEIRNGFHATAESRLYSDLSGRPCFAEEMGSLGPMVASEELTADYARSALYTLWAHDCRAMLWWCAYDQMHLDFAPYDQIDCERELGLIGNDRRVKPFLKVVGEFRKIIEKLPFEKLPKCKREAVCILTDGQNAWSVAYSSYILAKQAGFDIKFQHIDAELNDAELYLLPSINEMRNLDNRTRKALLNKVKDGAILYVSFGNAFFEPFKEFFGLNIQFREKSIDNDICFEDLPGKPTLKGKNIFRLVTKSIGADVLGREDNGNIAFSCNKVGRGRIYYLSFPVEQMLSETPGAFHGQNIQEYYKIYQELGKDIINNRVVKTSSPFISVTEHEIDNSQLVVVLINHSSQAIEASVEILDGWTLKTLTGDGEIDPHNSKVIMKPNDGVVLLGIAI